MAPFSKGGCERSERGIWEQDRKLFAQQTGRFRGAANTSDDRPDHCEHRVLHYKNVTPT